MNRNDVGVREPSCGALLTQEPLACFRLLREMQWQNLDRDVTIELDVARKINDTHSASAQLPFERIFAGERGVEVEKLGRESDHASP